MSWLTDQLNVSGVHHVVQCFYMKARNDATIGHYFDGIDDFSLHEERITAFWWLALGGTTAQLSGPVPSFDMINKHIALGIDADDLEIWLNIFEQTLFENLEAGLASDWLTKAGEIAGHLKAMVADGKSAGLQIREPNS